jgi:CBS domain-containing protein
MTSQITFYLSQILGKTYSSEDGTSLGTIRDFLVDQSALPGKETEPIRPRVVAIKVKRGNETRVLDFSAFEIRKFKQKFRITCLEIHDISPETFGSALWLAENILYRQIVDINGRQLVRVHDIRMVMIPAGTYAIAVDVGMEGVFRKWGLSRLIQTVLNPLRLDLPSRFILWDDIEAVEYSNNTSKQIKSKSKLNTLHPSDLADIIEELDKRTRTYLFASLDEEQAADVLEELEPHAQIHLVESLPVEKVADLLEKMPADEVADLLDALREEKAEKLLDEMEKESSEEVRELLEYPDDLVGSLMTTDYHTFSEDNTVQETIELIRQKKPEPAHIYAIFVVDRHEHFISSISLGELVVANPDSKLRDIMNRHPVPVFDDDKIESLADLVSKYNLLAVPVITKTREMAGVVVVEDIVEDLLNRRKTR